MVIQQKAGKLFMLQQKLINQNQVL